MIRIPVDIARIKNGPIDDGCITKTFSHTIEMRNSDSLRISKNYVILMRPILKLMVKGEDNEIYIPGYGVRVWGGVRTWANSSYADW